MSSGSRSAYGSIPGANLLDWPITLAEMEPWYAKAEDKMGVTRTNGIPGLPGNNNFKVLEAGAKKLGYKEVHTGRHGDQQRAARRPRLLPADRLLLPGLQVGRQMVDALHRDPQGRSHRQSRGAPQQHGDQDRARRSPARSPAWSMPTRAARCSARRRAWSRSPATRSRARGCCSTAPPACSRTGSPIHPARSAATTCGT